jgi:quinol monooxygenase YgiN
VDGSPNLHLYEIYDDQAAFDAHLASPYFGEFRTKSADWFTAPPVIKVLSGIDVAK